MSVASTSYSYKRVNHGDCSEEIFEACANLFSNHYGLWADNAKYKGRVTMKPAKLRRDYMYDERCGLVYATKASDVVGHCFYRLFNVDGAQGVWITQLVIHTDHRKKGISKNLQHMAFPYNWQYAGIVTSHPYAVRGFERATDRKCDPRVFKPKAPAIIEACGVSYLRGIELSSEDDRSIVDTQFLISHDEIKPILEETVRQGNWLLGKTLPDGHEFLAIACRTSPFLMDLAHLLIEAEDDPQLLTILEEQCAKSGIQVTDLIAVVTRAIKKSRTIANDQVTVAAETVE